MEPLPPRARRAPRVFLGGLLLFGLLMVVSLATQSGFGGGSDAEPSRDLLSYAYTAFLVLWVLAIPATLWAMWVQGSNIVVERPGFKRVVIQNVATVAILCLLIGGALYLRSRGWHPPDNSALKKTGDAVNKKKKKGEKAVAEEPTFKWSVALGMAGLLVIVSVPLTRAYLKERDRRRQRTLRRPLSQREQIAADFEVLIDDLRAEPDARRAIIASYARMEAVFAKHDLPRRRSETAGEYLHRIVHSLTARTEAVERLTALFERAKFGAATMDETARNEAIAALETIRDDVDDV